MFDKYYSERIKSTPSSFVREILKVTQKPEIISFAGGLPNPISFPQEELKVSMNRIADTFGAKIYQYSTTLGLDSLRQYIVDRYKKIWGMDITIDNVIITTGSQQALDLLGKVFINENDNVMVELPSYLGLLQVFSMYKANFVQTKLNDDGLDIKELKKTLKTYKPKAAYLIPNFQNPTGLTYTKENREKVFECIKDEDMILIQDDPYGELRFEKGERIPYIGLNQSAKNVYLGSFSKIVTPGMRLGYIIADKEIIKMLETAKQASDLHSNIFGQYMIADYLLNNDLDKHIEKIIKLYKTQATAMVSAMEKYFPKDVKFTRPKGGMFTWVTLKEGTDVMELFDKAIKRKVAFVPGHPFYVKQENINTLRLNYTNADENTIVTGIKSLAEALNEI
ncbi:MAG: PLP-dependent aminotransferase family protein [Candidatus Gastranaerophilales bacterium]|nr:PLP-dependent aminotransferase family protein [Candidatus Gastranaerophilales bacterium]